MDECAQRHSNMSQESRYNGQRPKPGRDRGNHYVVAQQLGNAVRIIIYGGKMPRKGQKTGKIVKCRICGKEIYKTLSYINRGYTNHYCSNECANIGRHLDTYEIRKCEICGCEFEVKKKSTQRFCSIGCQHEWQKLQVGPLNSRYKRVDKCCTWCGQHIAVCEYKSSQEHLFCSTKCRQEWYANVFSQSEEWINQSRMRAVDILESGVISQTKSHPQKKVDAILQRLGIKYEREYNLKYYAADNFLTDYNLIIEVMGDFWHANPQKYDCVKYQQQKKSVARDKRKHSYVVKHMGIEILYLWENDIVHHQDVCEKLIIEYTMKHGVLQNYHSFNWEYNGEGLQLKPDIVVPYQDYEKIPTAA